MPLPTKKVSQDVIRIGDCSATQPLSGTTVVSTARVKGYGNVGFTRLEETTKKAS